MILVCLFLNILYVCQQCQKLAKINQPTAFFSYITKAKENYFKLHGTIILQQLFTIPTKTKNDFKLRF